MYFFAPHKMQVGIYGGISVEEFYHVYFKRYLIV